jgi:hypothetical protein
MSSFKERSVFPRRLLDFPTAGQGAKSDPGETVTVQPDVTIFNWTATNTTMTPTRVDTGTAGSATGTATFNATDSVAAANLQVVIRALGGIYANATVVAGVTADNMIITVPGGYDITWINTGGTGTIIESGAAGSDTATPGSVLYQKELGIGKFSRIYKLVLKGFNDASLDIDIKDVDGKSVFVATGISTSTSSLDVPYVKLLGAAGVAGEDGAVAVAMPGLFRGPLIAKITPSAPADGRNIAPRCTLVCEDGDHSGAGKRFLQRTTGARAALSGALPLGSDIAIIRKIKLLASSDTTVAPTLTDADGLVVYTKSSSNFTTAVLEQLTHEGVNQANGLVADLLPVMAKGPLTLSGSGLGTGTFTVTVWAEV